jgi:DNA repair protein RadC
MVKQLKTKSCLLVTEKKKDPFMLEELQATYMPRWPMDDRPTITCSEDAAALLHSIWQDINLVESVWVMALNNSSRVKGLIPLSKGGIAGAIIDPRIVFGTLAKGLATAFILAHNHPSGQYSPSQTDKDVANKLKEAGKILDINLIDCLILTPGGGHYSFADDDIL